MRAIKIIGLMLLGGAIVAAAALAWLFSWIPPSHMWG